MKFNKIIGKCDPKIIREAEEKLSAVFTELSLSFSNKSLGSGIGGCPLTFQLVYPLPHICDALAIQLDDIRKKEETIQAKIKAGEPLDADEKPLDEEMKEFRKKMSGKVLRTAATDGRRFYWNPQFVVDQSRLGLRIVVAHEAWHAIFLHPSRRGSRIPRLWNIAVDYRVNYTIMEDLRAREVKDYPKVFTDSLGEYIHLDEYAAFLRDPFNPPPRLAHFNPTNALRKMADPAYQDPYEDAKPMYYADDNLSDDMKRPENVYEYLLAQIPKCPKCGKLGKYKKPEEYKALQKKIEERKKEEKKKKEAKEAKEKAKQQSSEKQESGSCKEHKHDEESDDCCDHDHGQEGKQPGQSNQPDQSGQPQATGDGEPGEDDSCCEGGCSECGGDDSTYIDPFGAGDTLDDHIDSDISEEELGKRITDAMDIAKRMAGKVPGSLELELGMLISPVLNWEDFVRQQMSKKRNGFGKSDWMKPRTRPMFAGLYVPRKRDYFLNILAAYDCSGSMSKEDVAFGISQLQVIDERGEIFCVSWDSKIYWETMVKINKADKENLQKVVVKGGGGTHCAGIFNEYEEYCGKVDLIIIMTDGFLYDNELADVKRPPRDCQTLWLITSHNPNFKPPFGRVMHLKNEKT